MIQERFYVDKSTHTFADSLAAFGLAAVLQEVLDRAEVDGVVSLQDQGGYYELVSNPAIEDAWINQAGAHPIILAPVIRTLKNSTGLPTDLLPAAAVDYEGVRDHRNAYWDARKQLVTEAKRALARGDDHPALLGLPAVPDPRWDVFRALNPASLISYNALMCQWWQCRAALPDVLRLLFSMTATTPNDLDGAEVAWKKLAKLHGLETGGQASASQLYNPAQGKGQNRAKANNLSMGNLKGFWLPEWLKAVGFYPAGLTKLLKGSKDRKTYVIAPRRIDMKGHDEIMRAFRGSMAFGEAATRSDILVALRYTQTFLKYCQQAEGRGALTRWGLGGRVRDSINGFYVAFYKNLGNSAATMNLSFINLPGWVRLSSPDDISAYRNLLEEHEQIIRPLDESHSDAYELLLHYRNFIAGDDLSAFFDFATAYSSYLIGQKERGKFALQFTVENLRRLMMSIDAEGRRKLSEILDPERHSGFDHIAYAIRQSTVIAQYRKQQGDRRYDVRYGLGQELARRAKYPADFITALSDFLYKYNAENAQVMEGRSGPYRRSIQVDDIQDIVALVDEHGSELICNLLVAYGYARSRTAAHSATGEPAGDTDVAEAGVDMPSEDGDDSE